ncbi:TetR/AcrR family transcriptional regulator [Nonomuraea sp. NPDC050328]|uniref:TetR/AcrR family transcriptional regulator n=1 Tax=Nonomuraea sp. NPDC050328 TaxID=3364361 RepID=UPI003795A9C3
MSHQMAVSKEQIITAAIRHLNGSPAASMGQIAQAAGISRATLHRHFATREDLIIALGWRAHAAWERAQAEAGLEEALGATDRATLEQALHRLITQHIEVAEEHGFALTEHLMEVDDGLVRRAHELEEREVVLIEACQRAGVLRSDMSARWISNVFFGLLVTVRESLRRGDVARRDVPRLLLETFLRGIHED